MVEETKIAPCPICGGAPQRSDPSLYCSSCGFLAIEDWWNKLSHAAELARAVERLGEHIPVMGGVSFNKPDGAQFQASIISGLGWHVTISAQSPLCDTPDAALIALAEQVNDASK